MATEANVKKLSGTLGWGAAGGLVLGPVGLLAGLLLGGKKTEVTFICTFVDGRAFIATGDHRTWVAIKGASLGPIASNLKKEAEKASAAQFLANRSPREAEVPSTSDPLEFIHWAFRAGDWNYCKLPKRGYERYVLFEASRAKRSVLLIHTPDAITDHSLSVMAQAMAERPNASERIIVGPRAGSSAERTATRLGITIGTLQDLKLVIAK